jgi:CubicO group peptidase (beta-lactamase class C family)
MIRPLPAALVLFAALALPNLQGQAPVPADPLVGLWSSETVFRQGILGELAVTRRGSTWRATVAGAEAQSELHGDRVRFVFPATVGEFRGTLDRKHERNGEIQGFWLQPAGDGPDIGDPGGSGQPFASPLVLRPGGGNTWRGTVRPLEGHFTLYLKVFPDGDGTLLAAFRNPEAGSIGRATQFRVSREGESVVFSAKRDPRPEIRLTATLAASPERLRISWPDLGKVVELTRRTPQQAAGFFPRPAGSPTYAYRKPDDTGAGWSTARASDVGMDEAALVRLVQRLIDLDPSVRRPALMHSMLVARHGKLVLEEYFFGFGRDVPHDTRSAGKTFSSVMLGAVMRQGVALTPETPVYSLLAGMGPFANPDPRKSQITLSQLMTHTSGLACDDNEDSSPGNEDTMQRQPQRDWWKFILDLPVAHDPGSRYAYCSGGMSLMGAALTTATRTWLPELFERTIARPLQFGPHYWNLMPTGEGYLGGGAFLRPRDLLKVGQLYLDGGVWHGRRIVDASWVKTSTAQRVEITPATTGIEPNQFAEYYSKGAGDALAWHLSELRSGDRTYHAYGASGNGGQLLIVVPELDMTVVFTAGNYGQGGIWGKFRDEIVPLEIIPAIRR